MDWHGLNRPLTARRTLLVVGGIAGAVAVFLAGQALLDTFSSGTSSPRQARRAIRKYLNQHVHQADFRADYDLDLKQKVNLHHTNAARLRLEAATLQTNLNLARTDFARRRRQLDSTQAETRTLTAQVREAEAQLKERDRRVAGREAELRQAETAVALCESNRTVIRQTIRERQAALPPMTNAITSLQAALASSQTNRNAPHPGPGAAPTRNELSDARKQLAEQQRQHADTLRVLQSKTSELKRQEARCAAAHTAATTSRERLAAAKADRDTAAANLASRREKLAANQSDLARRQADVKNRQELLNRLQTEQTSRAAELAETQKALYAGQRLLARQPQVYLQNARQRVAEAGSYEAIYRLIGQHLELAGQLLSGPDPDQQRFALHLMADATQIASEAALDDWLAARICQGYLWPNVDRKDPGGKPLHNPEDLLQVCVNRFQRADETNHVIHTQRLLLAHASNPQRADRARFALAVSLEQTGQRAEAIRLYRAVQDTNMLPWAERRLTILERNPP
ncbi:MAG: hypothetical protein JXQ71_16545 [Verrucomicrobia bacterium]|nr:hypothetical protein [Verrucomicrobiota bacterium]